MINRFLATLLSAINALLAIAIIIVGVVAGASYDNSGLGLLVGLVGGILAAVMVCGLLALLLDIRAELRELVILGRAAQIRDQQRSQTPV